MQRVFTDTEPDVEPVAAFVDELVAKPDAAIGLAIFPRVALHARRLGEVRRTRPARAQRIPRRRLSPGLSPARRPRARWRRGWCPPIRRTPDPTLQLVRASLLDNLRGQVSPTTSRETTTRPSRREAPLRSRPCSMTSGGIGTRATSGRRPKRRRSCHGPGPAPGMGGRDLRRFRRETTPSGDLVRPRHTRCYYRGPCEAGPYWSGWVSRCWPRAAVTTSRPANNPPPLRIRPPTRRRARCARPGNICMLAGTGVPGDGQDGLPARETRLYLPQDTTVGPDGRPYVVDWNNHRIRVIEADGRMRIVAGAGELGIAADDPSTGRLNHPDQRDLRSARLARRDVDRRVAQQPRQEGRASPAGLIIDMCGTGKRGFAGNGGPAAMAVLDLPVAHRVRRRRKSF